MLNCKHASRLVSQQQERRLSLLEWAGLKFHLLLCDACRNFSRQLSLLHEALRRMVQRTENDGEVRLSGEARKRISSSLRNPE